MLTKLLIFLGVVVGVFVIARLMGARDAKGSGRKLGGPGRRRRRGGEDLVECPACGAYVARRSRCGCGEPPTP